MKSTQDSHQIQIFSKDGDSIVTSDHNLDKKKRYSKLQIICFILIAISIVISLSAVLLRFGQMSQPKTLYITNLGQ
jgi:hypothetical protein